MRSVYSLNEFKAAYQLSFLDAWRLFSCHGPDRLALDLAMVVEATFSADQPAPLEIPDQVAIVHGTVLKWPARGATNAGVEL